MIDKRTLKIIEETMAIEAKVAKEAGQHVFMARAIVQTLLNHDI